MGQWVSQQIQHQHGAKQGQQAGSPSSGPMMGEWDSQSQSQTQSLEARSDPECCTPVAAKQPLHKQLKVRAQIYLLISSIYEERPNFLGHRFKTYGMN